jgi:hypothetical protein
MDQDLLVRAVEEARRSAQEAKLECMVLQTVCAALMAEVAVLTEDPRATLDRMVASLHGLAFGVGRSGGQPHMTKTVEQICQMAEDGFQPSHSSVLRSSLS